MIQNYGKSLLVMATLSIGLSACSNKTEVKELRTLDIQSIKASAELAPADKAERLAEAAERLLTPTSFMYAFDVAKLALENDPFNTKARFLVAAIGPQMEMKGVLTRIEPFIRQRPDQYAKYMKMIADLQVTVPESSLRNFLLDGPMDITNDRDAQELLARVTLRFDDFRRTMIALKDKELTLTIADENFKKLALERAQSRCEVQRTEEYIYEFTGEACDLSRAYEVKLNRADFEGLQLIAAGYQTYLTVLNLFDLNGLYAKAPKLGENAKADMKLLLSTPSFATLRSTHGMGVLPDVLRDSIVGVKYAINAHNELCDDTSSREGHLFDSKICVHDVDTAKNILNTIEQVLQGPYKFPIDLKGQANEVLIDAPTFFAEPIRDLRNLAPFKTNNCGDLIQVNDGTFGGLFPTGDLNKILSADADDCQ